MNNFKRLCAAAMTVLILGSLLTLSVPLTSLAQVGGGGQPIQNVNVVNNPLPISGNVTVTNPSSQPVPVVGAIEPFQDFEVAGFSGPGANSAEFDFGGPPAGKLLMVEQLSVNVTTDASEGVAAFVDLEVRQGAPSVAVHRIVLTRQDFGGTFAVFLANTQLLAFVKDNQTLHVQCGVTPTPTTTVVPGCIATVAGRLVVAP